MEVKVNKESKTKKEIEIIISPQEIEEYTAKAVENLSFQKKINGFRPGKVPRKIIEDMIGKEAIWAEACNLAIKESYRQVMEKENYLIVSQPEIKIQTIEFNKPLSYKIVFYFIPEIILPDYRKIAADIFKNKKELIVEEKEVDELLEELRRSRAKIKAVARKSQFGDQLLIDFQGLIDGITQANFKSEKVNFVIGESKFIKGFEEELIGLKQGDSKEFFLDTEVLDSQQKKIKKRIKFNVKVHSVFERELPELNDDFARILGNFSDLNDLRLKLKTNIKKEKEIKEKEKNRLMILEEIIDKTSTEIPEFLIEEELKGMIEAFKKELPQFGFSSFDEYLKKTNKKEEMLKKEWSVIARKRVLGDLIFEEIVKKENIIVSEEEINQEVKNYLSRFHDEIKNLPAPDKLKEYFKRLIKKEKVFNFLEKQQQNFNET